ncbi:MAG: 50S ribosomal protein L9, partial [Terriglobales bacterium]
AGQLNGVTITLVRRSGEHDQLFGSVTSSDLASELEKKGFTIDRRKIELDQPIKTTGEFSVPVRLFREVTATVKVEVRKEEVAE